MYRTVPSDVYAVHTDSYVIKPKRTHVASWRALCKAGVQLRRKRPLRCEASCPDVLPCGRFLGTVSDLETEEVTAIFIRSKDFLEPLELSAVRVQDAAVLNTLPLPHCQVRLPRLSPYTRAHALGCR